MDWTAYIDSYCERTAPGLWNEPLNAVTNLAFWLAAGLVAWRCRKERIPLDLELGILLGLLVAIGAASLAFHTVANRVTGAADSLFIALYLHAWLALYLRRAWGWSWGVSSGGTGRRTVHPTWRLTWRCAWLGLPAFFCLAQLASAGWRLVGVEPAGYLGAWSVLLLVTLDSTRRRSAMVWPLAGAAAVFAVSVTLRQLDLPLCTQWHWGTHFGWHLLNGVTLGLTAWALAIAPADTSPAP